MIKRLVIGCILSLAILATSWALVHPEFFRIHDYTQAARVAEMGRALQEGQFPVRWSRNFGFGYGMPLYEFYAPLPYYVGAGLWLAGLDVVLTLKVLWLLCTVLTLIGAYKLGTELYGRSGGVLTAVALTVAPYRAVNLYIRGALAEAWGIMAMPWILLSIVWVIRKKNKAWVGLVLSLVTLFLSHNLTTLIFVPLSLVFAAGFLVIEHRQRAVAGRTLLTLAGSYLLAIGLSVFYLVPAFMEKGYTKVSEIVGGYFDYSLHFLYLRQFVTPYWGFGGSNWGPSDGLSFFLGWGHWLGLISLGLAFAWWLWHQVHKGTKANRIFANPNLKRVVVIGLLMVLAVFMTLEKSRIIWDNFFLLPFIQFPWRWLGGAVVFMSLVIGSVVVFIPAKGFRYVTVLGLSAVILAINWWYFQPESYLPDANGLYYTDAGRIQEHMSEVLSDYIPAAMPKVTTIPFHPQPPTQLLLTNTHQPNALEVLVDHSHERLLRVDFTQPAPVELTISDFPGWKVEIDGQTVEKTTSANGLIGFTVPAGQHLVGAYFGSTPIRMASDVVSLVSLLIFLYLVIDLKNRHNQKP